MPRRIAEMEAKDVAHGRYDPNQDRTKPTPNKVRKKGLRLRDINRLKKLRALRRMENLKREDLLGLMYSQDDAAPGGGGMF